MVVESLVAIALMGTIAASAQVLHRTAVDARLRSVERIVTLWEARSVIEALSGVPGLADGSGLDGLTVDIGPSSLTLTVEVTASAGPDGLPEFEGSCTRSIDVHGRSVVWATTSRKTDGVSIGRVGSVVVSDDRGSTAPTSARPDDARLTVRLAGHDGSTPLAADVLVTSVREDAVGGQVAGAGIAAAVDTIGCAHATGLTAGSYRVQVLLDDGIDRLHRPLTDVEERLATTGLARLVVRADRAAMLTTTFAAPTGARLPDASDQDGLRWAVGGDGVTMPAMNGESRPLHPGDVGIVVGVCGSTIEHASWFVAHLEAGLSHELEVLLPAVQLASIEVPPGGVSIVAQRDADCPGAGGVRPTLRWSEANTTTETVQRTPTIALPNGRWQVRIESMSGQLLAGPSALHVATPTSATS
jgi:hypothetical protein